MNMTSNIDSMNLNENNSSPDLQLDIIPDSIVPESDNDSGIVAIGNPNRIGSTASNSDEDHIFKDRLNHSVNHSLLYGSKPRVRFDDELPLSEQNMRKSCKKLFETLWVQNKDGSAIGTQLNDESIKNSSLLPPCHCHHFTQTLPSVKSVNNCCSHSDLNLNTETTYSFDDNELLLTHYGQNHNYGGEKQFKRQQKYNTLDNRHQSRSFCSLNNKMDNFEDKNPIARTSLDCDAALDRIKRMSDQLESSSMVNAFARPAFIKNTEFAQTMDTLYETIFPTEKTNNFSPKSSVNRWLNNNRVESLENMPKVDDSLTRSLEISASLKSVNKLTTDLNSKKSILKSISNDIPRANTLSPSKSSYISADQIYPDHCDNNLGPEVYHKFEASYDEQMDQRFSHSFTAGDDGKRGILRHRLKSAMSEIDLNQTKLNSSPKSKSFLQRFKSVFTRAFTTDRNLSKQQSVLDLNTVRNSKSLSQSDLRVNVNPKGSKSNLSTRMDRSPSFVKNIRTRMSLRKNNKDNSPQRINRSNSHKVVLSENYKNKCSKQLDLESDGTESQVWGELIKLNSDASQVIQIHRQKGRAFGFFVARGTVNKVKGVFVSRMKDDLTQKCLTGVLEIGDEILAIDGESVKEANIMRVNQLIANKDTIRLTIIPYMNNKYL